MRLRIAIDVSWMLPNQKICGETLVTTWWCCTSSSIEEEEHREEERERMRD